MLMGQNKRGFKMNDLKKLYTAALVMTIYLVTSIPMGLSAQQPLKFGTTAAGFLELGVGARGVALGDAYVAIAEGAEGAYWNPAGIGMLTKMEASFMQMDYVAGIQLQNIAFALPIPGIMTLGVMVTNLSVPDDKIRTVEDPEGTNGETFEAGSFSLALIAARKFTDRFSVGLSLKYVHEQLYQETASALAFDFGVLFKTQFLNDMTLGMSITNFGTKMQFTGPDLSRQHADREDIAGTIQSLPVNYETDKWSLPIAFRIGVAMDVLDLENQSFVVSVDALHPNNIDEYVNIGGEYSNVVGSFGKVSLRGGYNTAFQKQSQQGLTLGGGLNVFVNNNFSVIFDYAYADYEFFGDIHRYSVGLIF